MNFIRVSVILNQKFVLRHFWYHNWKTTLYSISRLFCVSSYPFLPVVAMLKNFGCCPLVGEETVSHQVVLLGAPHPWVIINIISLPLLSLSMRWWQWLIFDTIFPLRVGAGIMIKISERITEYYYNPTNGQNICIRPYIIRSILTRFT